MTSISQRALAASAPKQAEMPAHERPISEMYRLLGEEWADLDGAATLLAEMKTTTLSQLKTKLIAERGEMTDARAERIVKSSPEWEKYIRNMCENRMKANKLKVKMDSLRMQLSEWIGRDANARSERNLGGR